MQVTHKLIWPNSSWRASSSSESSSLQEEEEEEAEPGWAWGDRPAIGVSLSTRSLHSCLLCCFMRCKTCWTLARTEWLLPVDWKEGGGD